MGMKKIYFIFMLLAFSVVSIAQEPKKWKAPKRPKPIKWEAPRQVAPEVIDVWSPCLNPRRGLTLLSAVCRDPAIGV